MALDKQIHVYSVDTSAFYTDEEKIISEPLTQLYQDRHEIKLIQKDKRTEKQNMEYKKINKKINSIKITLKESMNKNTSIRKLDNSYIIDKNIVSVFESDLTRVSNFKTNQITTDIIIVKAFYYKVLEDIITYGFYYEGEKYKVFTASAGQIRTKKTVFIKEKLWDKIENTLTCGMTMKIINSKGGINVNKYLAYLALTNSATDKWDNFDIDRCIVVDDFKTTFKSLVDYIDEKTYEINNHVEKDITIPHMDGCGIHLPIINKKPFMVRLPWVKGLLAPMKFDIFIKEHLNEFPKCNIIKDIYGKEWDIFKDNIQIIFTKSQLKLWKYYDSWDDYKNNFKKYNCNACKCNEEPDRIKNAKINYQMLQTLEDMTTKELDDICNNLNNDIYNISRDRNTMLKVLGVTDFNENKNSLQQSIEIYPELLQDEYCRQVLRDVRKKIVKQGKAGKIPIDGKYTFLLPDLYAFCEWLFLKIEIPNGILKNNEVSCKLYKEENELDVLRAPHLYMEHAIRKNIINSNTKKWFITKGIYTSTHDAISRILNFDVDGDFSLVVKNQTIINVAKRNIKKHKIIPLYYDMAKAEPKILNNKVLYDGMKNAYSGGNIGAVSNNITKIWNSEGDIEEKLEVIKYLCMENNFVIDYAKTLYKPIRPNNINKLIKKYTKNKTPYFFIYAKDKELYQVEKINNTTVNKLDKIIKDIPFNFKKVSLGDFNYKNMMYNKKSILNQSIIDRYEIIKRKVMFQSFKEYDLDTKEDIYIWKIIKKDIIENDEINEVIDSLIIYLFSDKKRNRSKKIFWECFGDEIVQNLKNNIKKSIKENFIMCQKCGSRVKSKSNRTKYCEKCAKEIKKQQDRIADEKYRNKIKNEKLENFYKH